MESATRLQENAALRKSLKVERYAEVLAHVVHFGTERAEEVVRRFGLTLEAWRAVDAAWVDELAEGARRNQQDQALRFSATFAKRRRRLAQEQPALDAIGDGGAPPAGAGAPSGGVASAPLALPSFMTAASAPAAAEAPASPAPAPPSPAPAPATELALDKGFTQPIPIPPAADPLPFAGGVASEVALRSAIDHAESVQGPRPARAPALGVTAPSEGERIAAIARQILPFSSGGPARDSDPGPAPEAPAGDGAPTLTLAQHASLNVELGLHPDQTSQTLRRYGLTPEQHARLDASWQAKIAQDSAVRSAWEAARARYRAWLLRNKV